MCNNKLEKPEKLVKEHLFNDIQYFVVGHTCGALDKSSYVENAVMNCTNQYCDSDVNGNHEYDCRCWYACLENYQPDPDLPPSIAVCSASGKWTGGAGRCRSKSNRGTKQY